MKAGKHIWTIGHSTRPMALFIEMLRSFSIAHLVDVRQFPGSRKYPHFNSDALAKSLAGAGIGYTHIIQLGGRRKSEGVGIKTAWEHPAFQAYAAYMQTPSFEGGIEQLSRIAITQPTAYMCSEAVWWRCHRALISDYLKVAGWEVGHIMDVGKSKPHPFTKPARVEDGVLKY